MGRHVSLIILLLLAVNLMPAAVSRADVPADNVRELVLVTSETAEIPPMSHDEVRRIFIGIQFGRARLYEAVINQTDPVLYQVFLQKVIYMSARHYERRILANVFRSGGRRLASFGNEKRLVDYIRRRPAALSYMWGDEAKAVEDLRVVQVLWRGVVE